jgi:hypothetical protein
VSCTTTVRMEAGQGKGSEGLNRERSLRGVVCEADGWLGEEGGVRQHRT